MMRKYSWLPYVLLGLGLFAGTAIGIGWSLQGKTVEEIPSLQSDEVERRRLQEAMHSLTTMIDRLRGSIESAAFHDSTGSRVPIDPSVNGFGQVQPILTDLSRNVQEMSTLLVNIRDLLKSVNVGVPVTYTQQPVPEAVFAQLSETPEVERDQAHFFWTYQQVLDKYGPPTTIRPQPGAGVKWYYETAKYGKTTFWFMDGHLTAVIR